jgi:serine kinase of HPr protein (carbohydrate metabolism regulator)
LPLFFTIEETYDFLHAGAVEIDGKPILFIAESFGGKSTMTDFFLKHGHILVSDDKVAIYENNGEFLSVPSHPHHRPHRAMEDLGFFVENIAKEPKPIHAIYELEKSDADVKIKIEQINGVEKFKSLRYASEINIFFLKQKRFEFLMRMANVVTAYKVCVPWDMERLKEVHDAIYAHSEKIDKDNK